MSSIVDLIDLFAGPGGLGEGFHAVRRGKESIPVFRTLASVEKDAKAHATLTLRAFYRQFGEGRAPDQYYDYVKGKVGPSTKLFEQYPDEHRAAYEETMGGPKELGPENQQVKDHISKLASGSGPKVVIGGPPCQAYSLVGRARNLGNKDYVAEDDHRHTLYKEYLDILAHVEPDIFVMENVRGILSSKYDGERIFPNILDDLKCPSDSLGLGRGAEYNIFSFVGDASDLLSGVTDSGKEALIRSENFGVPQARHRVILLGVRKEILVRPKTFVPSNPLTVGDVIGDLVPLRAGFSKKSEADSDWYEVMSGFSKDLAARCEYDFIREGAKRLHFFRGNELGSGGRFVQHERANLLKPLDHPLLNWLDDPLLEGWLNHEARPHMNSDLQRYMFASLFAASNLTRKSPSPKAKEFPDFLAPAHQNWNSGKFSDRFKVQCSSKVSSTITNHISKDGHYFIHPDPNQCRSLTVREAARLQTFPDNYFFEGERTSQFGQVGNAVPPYLAKQVAEIVLDLLDRHYEQGYVG